MDESKKTPPDPAQIQALLDKAALDAGGRAASEPARKPYRAALILGTVLVGLMLVLYFAVQWMAAQA